MSAKMAAPHSAENGSVVPGFMGPTSSMDWHGAYSLHKENTRPPMDWVWQVYDHMPDAVFFITDHHRIAACNRAAVTLFGYEESDLLGRKIDFGWSATPDIQLRGRWADHGVVRAGLARTKGGDQFPAALTIIRARLGDDTFAVAIFEDFRTERETLLQVQELQRELARLARMVALSEMTPTLAHELSQPLSSIAAYSQGCGRLVRNDRHQDGEALREALSEITQHALWAGTIVQNIRDFVKPSAGKKEPEAMSRLIQEAVTLALTGLERQGFRIDLELETERDVVFADHVEIVQVLTNLLRNAVDATDGIERPHITIRMRADGFSHIAVDVSDNGCGIEAGIEEVMFHPFVTTKPRGLGMGLALSKRIVEAHEGRISLRTTGLENGSTLSFSLPLVEIDANGARPYDPSCR